MTRCKLCNDWTPGSLSVNGNFCACLCQECRDLEDHAAEMGGQAVAAAFDALNSEKPQELETIA